ncbi:RHS repeat-associated protein [Flavobacterium sp. 81]|nr:RHS repeat-associated core domain-containing protein [Flavobacterium sp. 81]RKR10999.1 RHS repeat-associated protein [Flavobacterium sp. 81]
MLPQGWMIVKKNATNYTFSLYGGGSTSSTSKHYERIVNFPLDVYDEVCNSTCKIVSSSQSVYPKKIISGDFNGDGLTDVIAIDLGTSSMSYCGDDGIKRCVTQSDTMTLKNVYFVDLKRDKTSDFLTHSGKLAIMLNDLSKIEVIDFNGDGKSDFIIFDPGSVRVYTLDNANKLVLLYKSAISDSGIVLDKPILMGDFNGDGKTDFVIPQTDNVDSWNFYFSTGTVFNKVNTAIGVAYYTSYAGYFGVVGFPTTTYSINEGTFIANDFNGDGKTDILYQQNLTVEYIMGDKNMYARKGESQVTKLVLLENISSTGNAISFNLLNKHSQLAGVKRFPISIFTNHNKINQNLEYSLISDNAIISFNSPKDNRVDVLLKTITNGNGVKETITYKPLQQDPYEPIYTPTIFTETYPNIDIIVASGVKIVSFLEKQSKDVNKKQQFLYAGAVSNTEGLGFLGFRSTVRTNWYDDDNEEISTISKNDITLRGANTENYTVLGLGRPLMPNATQIPSANFITKTILSYESELLSNKVFKLKNTITKQFNSLDNTSSENYIEFDADNNPLKSRTYLKESGATIQTTVSDIAYNVPTASPYVIGRPKSKKQSVTVSGDVMTSEELYSYQNSLLTQIKKKGTNTDYIIEDNIYDVCGNITKKTITASGLTPRVTSYEYDPSGRFLTKSTDIEKLSTSFVYNPDSTLKSETNPYGLTTSYLYDSWFKKTTTTDYLGKKNSYAYMRSGQKNIVTTTADDGSASEETFDDLGRKVKEGRKNIMGAFSYVDYLYDIQNRNYKVSEPYFGLTGTQWNETKYDIYGRIIKNIAATGKTTDITYSGLSTTVNDGTKSKKSVKNAIGNVVSMTDTPGGTIKYTYFANGNLKESDYAGVKTMIKQDGWGRKVELKDSSAGIYGYDYNAFGEIISTTTPNGTTTYILDPAVGKVAQKTIKGINTDSKTTYSYDSSSKLLIGIEFTDVANGSKKTLNTITYDDSKRISTTIEATPYATFTKEFKYDDFGRVFTETFIAQAGGKSSSKTIKNKYLNGSHWQIVDNNTGAILWQTNTVNARGQLTSAQNGPTTVTNNYDSYGFASELKYDKTSGATNILTLNTAFDAKKGNLTSRTNSLFNRNESFKYDAQDRLIEFTNAKGLQEKQIYDDQGRITENSLGTYTYSKDKPYQNTAIDLTIQALDYYSNSRNNNNNSNNNEEIFYADMENKTGWSMLPQALQCISFDNTKTHTGNNSIKISTTPIDRVSHVLSDIALDINNTINIEYTFSGWVYSDSPTAELTLLGYKGTSTGYNYAFVDRVGTGTLNKWTFITKTILVPPDTKSLRLRVGNIGSGNVWYDDVQIYRANYYSTNGDNHNVEVFNDGMEYRTGWSMLPQASQCISFDNTKAYTGINSIKISTTSADRVSHVLSDIALKVNNIVSTEYTFSGWVYSDSPTAELTLFGYKGTSTGYNYAFVDRVGTGALNKWTFITKTILVPPDTKSLRLRVGNVGSGNVWYDDIQVYKKDNIGSDNTSQNITYNTFKSPVEITEAGVDKISFIYNDGNDRSAMFYGGLQDEKLDRPLRKYYSADGSMEIKENKTTKTFEFITYIGGDGYSAPIVVKSNGTTQDYLYLQRDYQGSIVAITNQVGAVVEKRSFDAWGAIVIVQDGAGNILAGLTILDRGYTGHEHLQSVGLINMNGRIYDSKLHRFLQPDNFVQDPFNAQNFNRYGYCWNNPLKYTDQSGEFIPLVIVGIIVVSAAINVYNNWDNITGGTGKFSDIKWDKFTGYTVSGAASGALTVYGGPYGVVIGAGVQSFMNSAIKGESMQQTVLNTMGGVAGGFVTRGIGLSFDVNFTNGLIGGNSMFNSIISGATREVFANVGGNVTYDLISTEFKNPDKSFKGALDPVNLGLSAVGGGLTGLNRFVVQPSYISQTQSPLINSLELRPITPFNVNPNLVIPNYIIPARNVIPPSFYVPKLKPQFKG